MSERDLSSGETVSDLVLPIELTVEQLTALTTQMNQSKRLSFTVGLARQSRKERAISQAETMLSVAQRRQRLSFGDYFSDPAWLILLDLFVRQNAGQTTSISSACIASLCPATTGLRYVTALTQSGVLLRTIDPIDHRRVNLELSADTEDQLIELLAC